VRGRWTAAVAIAAAQLIAAPANSQTVPVVTPDEIHALVAANRGSIVVVNFWATWCPPCLEEFPDIIEVYEAYRDDGVVVFAVSMNEADEADDVAAFLERFEPPFPIYRASSVDDAFYAGVADPWFGEMPITLIFDADGEQAHFHRRAVDYAGLAADLDALLGASR
jgi:thiol-disulfide isomerase/thioredoxin